MSYKSIYKTINKALEVFSVNNTLNILEESSEAEKAKNSLNKLLLKQLSSVVKKPIIERALSLSRKADINQLIIDQLSMEMYEIEEDDMSDLFILLVISANLGGQAALNRLNIDKTFNIKNSNFIKDTVRTVIPMLTLSSLRFLSSTIEQSKGLFFSISETMEFLNVKITASAKVRAEITIRNEIAKMVGKVEHEVFRTAGVKENKWVTVMDERVCQICEPMDGQIRGISALFVGGDGSTSSYPPIHIGCRCFLEPQEVLISGDAWTG